MFNEINAENIHFSAFDVELTNTLEPKKIIAYLQELKHLDKRILDIQSIRYDSILSNNHLLSAVWHAWNGFINKYTISNSFSIEFLLYVSGQRQITKALEFFGLQDETTNFSMIIFQDREIPRKELLSLISANKIIKEISPIKFTDGLEKRKKLTEIFDYQIGKSDDLLIGDHGFNQLEKYILSTIANLVFETSNSTIENKQNR